MTTNCMFLSCSTFLNGYRCHGFSTLQVKPTCNIPFAEVEGFDQLIWLIVFWLVLKISRNQPNVGNSLWLDLHRNHQATQHLFVQTRKWIRIHKSKFLVLLACQVGFEIKRLRWTYIHQTRWRDKQLPMHHRYQCLSTIVTRWSGCSDRVATWPPYDFRWIGLIVDQLSLWAYIDDQESRDGLLLLLGESIRKSRRLCRYGIVWIFSVGGELL